MRYDRAMVQRVTRDIFKSSSSRLNRILDAAVKEFSAHGYSDASLEAIATGSNISKGSLYYYINDKADLLYYLLAKMNEGVLDICDAVDAEGLSIEGRLKSFTLQHATYAAENARLLSIYYRSWPQLKGDRKDVVRRQRDAISQWMVSNIEDYMRSKGASDPSDKNLKDEARLAALFYFGSSNWMYTWYNEDSSLSPAVVGQHCSDSWLRSIGLD